MADPQPALPEQTAETFVPQFLRLPGTPATQPLVPPKFTGNRQLMYAHFIRNLRLAQTRLLQARNLVSLLSGELLAVLHLCSVFL